MLLATCIVDIAREGTPPLSRGYARLYIGDATLAEVLTPWYEDEQFAVCDLMDAMSDEFSMVPDTVRKIIELYKRGQDRTTVRMVTGLIDEFSE